MANVRLSKKYSLQVPDYVRGALLAAGSTALVFVQEWLDKEEAEFNWKLLIKVSASVFVSYLLKNGLFEKAKVIVTAKTNQKVVNAAEKINEVVTKP